MFAGVFPDFFFGFFSCYRTPKIFFAEDQESNMTSEDMNVLDENK